MARARQLQKRRDTGRLAKRRVERQKKFLKRRPSLARRIPQLRKQAKEIVRREKLQKDVQDYSGGLQRGEITNLNEVPSNVRPFFNLEKLQKETISKIDEQLETANERKTSVENTYNKKIADLRAWKTNARSRAGSSEERSQISDDYNEEKFDLDRFFKPQIRSETERINRYNQKKSAISSGELLSFEGVKSFADAYAEYKQKSEEISYKNIRISEKNKQLQDEADRREALLEEAQATGGFVVQRFGDKGELEETQLLTKKFEEVFKFKPKQIAELDKPQEITQQIDLPAETLQQVTEQAKVEEDKTLIQKIAAFLPFGSVAAARDEIDLKEQKPIDIDDNRVLDRVSDRKDDRMGFISSLRDRFGDFAFDIFKGGKEGITEEKEKARITGMVSAFDEPIVPFKEPEKTTFEKIADLPSKKLEEIREFAADRPSIDITTPYDRERLRERIETRKEKTPIDISDILFKKPREETIEKLKFAEEETKRIQAEREGLGLSTIEQKQFDKDMDLSPLGQEILERPLSTTGKLALGFALDPGVTLAGIGLAEQPEAREKTEEFGKKVQEFGETLGEPGKIEFFEPQFGTQQYDDFGIPLPGFKKIEVDEDIKDSKKKEKIEFFEPQFGTQQFDPLTGEPLPGFKKIEIEKIKGKKPEILGGTISLGGKAIRGLSTFIPETSGQVLGLSAFSRFGKSTLTPEKIKTGAFLGLGGFETYSGLTNKDLEDTEKYGKLFAGTLLGLGALPGVVKGAREIEFRLGGAKKTKPSEKGIETLDLDIGGLKEGKTGFEIKEEPFKLEFVPSQKEIFTEKVDPLALRFKKLNFKENPSLPKTTKLQKDILNIVRNEGDIVTGSFAQKSLIKGSRNFKDLDIISKDIYKLGDVIKQKLGDRVRIESKTIKDSPMGEFEILKVFDKKSGKHIADLDPYKYAEEGLASTFKVIKVNGLKLIDPQARLIAKTIQQARQLPKGKRGKVATDIAQLQGDIALQTSPSLLRGYGLTKKQQLDLFGGKEIISVHGGKGIVPRFSDNILLQEGQFFSTPSLAEGGVGFARKSRLGIGKDKEYAGFLDLVNPAKWKDLEFIPKRKGVIVEYGKIGKDFIQPMKQTTEIEVARVIPKGGEKLKIDKRFKTIVEGEPVEIAFAERIGKRTDTKGLKDTQTKGSKSRRDNTSKEIKDFTENMDLVPERRITKKQVRIPGLISDLDIEREDITREETGRELEGVTEPRIPEREIKRRPPERDMGRLPDLEPPRTPEREVPRRITRKPVRRPPIRLPPRTPTRRSTKKPVLMKLKKRRIKIVKKKKANSYDVWAKLPKQKKPSKIYSSLTQQDADDLLDYGLDKSTSRSGHLKASGQKPRSLGVKIPKGYHARNKKKFRTYKQKKGVRTRLPNKGRIERTKYALDTKSELKEINIFKKIAQLEKIERKPIKKIRRSKRPIKRKQVKKTTRRPVRKLNNRKNLPVGLNFK